MAPKPETLTRPKAPDTLALRDKPGKDLTFSDISKALYEAGDVVPMSEFGDGFALLDKNEKGRLVGVPFIILDWNFWEGDFGEAVTLKVITNANEKFRVNDGSTGIRDQMKAIAEKGEQRAIYVKKGLRRSDYEYQDKDGSKKPATTFYLDESA